MGGMILLNSDDAIEQAAWDAQEGLAGAGRHRTSIVDLFAAATAAAHGAVLLRYDSDYDRIGAALGAATRWVVPQGSM